MISFIQMDAIEKQKISATAENSEASALIFEEFAALLNVRLEMSNNFGNKAGESDEKTPENDSFETNRVFLSPAVQIAAPEVQLTQSINQQIAASETQNFTNEAIENNINPKSLLPLHQTDWQTLKSLQASGEVFSRRVKEELIKTNPVSNNTEVLNDAETAIDSTLLENHSSETVVETKKTKGESADTSPKLFKEVSNGFENEESVNLKQTKSSFFISDVSENEISGETQNIIQTKSNSVSNAIENKGALDPNRLKIETPKDKKQIITGKVFSDETQELIKTYFESDKAEVLNDAKTAISSTLFQNDSSEAVSAPTKVESESSGMLLRFFREISNVFKNEELIDPKQANSSAGFIAENKISDETQNTIHTKSNSVEKPRALNPNYFEIETPEDKKQIKIAEAFSLKAEESIKTNLQSAETEFVNKAENITSSIFLQNDSSETDILPAKTKSAPAGILRQLFWEISNVFKGEEPNTSAKQPEAAFHFISENEISGEIQNIVQTEFHSAENKGALNLNQSEIEKSKDKKQIITGEVFSRRVKEELIKTNPVSNNTEVLNDAETAIDSTLLENHSSETVVETKKTKGESADTSPKLFKEVSNGFENEESVNLKQTKSSFFISDVSENEISGETQNIIQTKSNSVSNAIENKGALDLNQSEIETPEDKKQIKITEDSSATNFDKTFPSATKEQKFFEASLPSAYLRLDKVIEQVEPKILQLLSFKNIENERKVMKMRLHPAELGTLEITLEKDSSGALNAHFQTETEAARQIIAQSFDQLRDALKNSGWLIERLEISCAPFSSTNGGSRENQSRQFETVENQQKTQLVSDNSSDSKDDLKPNLSNRLLSVRA